MKTISALIHLRPLGRFAPARVGEFNRPDKPTHPTAEGLHLWKGRELTVAEFNTEFPIAIKRMQGGEAVHGRIIERNDGTAKNAADLAAPAETAVAAPAKKAKK